MRTCEDLQKELVQLKERKIALEKQVLNASSVAELLLQSENLRRDVDAFSLHVLPDRVRLLPQLRRDFESQIEFWKKVGVVEEDSLREIPKWEDYEPLFTAEVIERVKAGYNVPVLTPYYLPFYDEDPDKQTFLKILAAALREEIERIDEAKAMKGISFKPRNESFFGSKISFSQEEPFFVCDEIKAHQESYQFQDDLPVSEENISQEDVIARGKTLEMKTGFIFKLFQDHAILPEHLWKHGMSANEWKEKIKEFDVLPITLVEYVAYALHILRTRHYLEDMTPSDFNSADRFAQVTLALGTALPKYKAMPEGVVAITYYFAEKQMNFEKYYLDDPFKANAFRGGIRLA